MTDARPVLGGMGAGLAAAVLLWIYRPGFVILIIAGAILVGTRLVLVSSGLGMMTPVGVIVIGYTSFAVAGYFLFNPLVAYTGRPAHRFLEVADSFRSAALILAASAVVLLGAGIGLATGGPPHADTQGAAAVTPRNSARGYALAHTGVVVPAASLVLLVIVLSAGPADVLERSRYLIGDNTATLFKASGLLGLAAVAACSTVAFSTTLARSRRRASVLLVVLFSVVNFAFATRELALMPPAIFCAFLLARTHTKKAAVAGGLLAIVLTLSLLRVPLHMRSQESHGLRPYASVLANNPGLLLPEAQSIPRQVQNLLGGFPVTAFVDKSMPIPIQVFWVSLNPLPDPLAGWQRIRTSVDLQVSPVIPFNAVGELANLGERVFIPYFLVVGLYAAHLSRKPRLIGAVTVRGAILAMTALFVAFSLQYHLRSASRVVVMLIIIELGVGFLSNRRPRKTDAALLDSGHARAAVSFGGTKVAMNATGDRNP